MLRFPITAQRCDDILYFLRPLPAQGADPFAYIEESLAELLSADETIADIEYRFSESSDGLLVAAARKKTLARAAVPTSGRCYRLPAAVELWLRCRHVLTPGGQSAFFLGRRGEHTYLVSADSRQVRRVFRLQAGHGDREVLLAVEAQRQSPETGGTGGRPSHLFSEFPLSGGLEQELRGRAISCSVVAPRAALPVDRAAFDQWDFRLEGEIEAQDLSYQKYRVVKSAVLSSAGIAGLWLLLFTASVLAGRFERHMGQRWEGLRSSLKEISYLQKGTRGYIGEIMLCRKLSEKRTGRASVLAAVAETRPPKAFLDELRIGPNRARTDKERFAAETLFLGGYSDDGREVTAWMDALLKKDIFTYVNLLSMEKKGAVFRFRIECGLGPPKKREAP